MNASLSLGIWTVRKESKELGHLLQAQLGGELYLIHEDSTGGNREHFARAFRTHRQWVLLMTTGIAVRYLQGLLKDKRSDPAAVVLDEAARFAIPLVGGHEGGANELAYRVANAVGAIPVITTATEALKPLVLGIGCRKGVKQSQIEDAVAHALGLVSKSVEDVREVATIELKAGEPGLRKWCDAHQVPLRVIRREWIAERPWMMQPSEWVKENIGLGGVCEPCALLSTNRGKLILQKTSVDGVTVAIVSEQV